MNSWLRALLYTFAFLLLFVWVALGLFDAERARGPIASWISQQTGVPVTIGRLVFNPLHPYTLLAEQVSYGDAVTLDKLYLEIESIDWLNRDVRIAHLDLIRPVIRLPLPNQLPNLPVHSLTISDSTIDRLSLQSDELTLSGLNATLNDWQLLNPVRPPQANLSLNINQLTTPALALSRLNLKGRLEGQVLSTDKLTTNLFDGLLETGMELDWPARSLRLSNLKTQGMRIEWSTLAKAESPLRQVSLDLGQIRDLGLLRRVFQQGFALGQRRGHEEVLGAGHGDHVGGDARALQTRPTRRQLGDHVAVFDHDLGAHGLQALDVLVHRARTDGATTRQRHLGMAKTCQQRPQCQHRRTHGFHQFVRRFWVIQPPRIQRDATIFMVLGRHAHVADQLEHGRHILQPRHIGQRDRLGTQQSGTQLGQGRVFGTRHIERTLQALAAANFQFVHGSTQCAF